MDRHQSNKYSMALTVQKVLADNDTLWLGITSIVNKKADLDAVLQNIADVFGRQILDITGNAEDKRLKKRAMANMALKICKPLTTYARDTGNQKLKEAIDFEFTELFKVKDVTSVERCQLVFDKADEFLSALGDYPISSADVASLQTLINDFILAIPKPRIAMSLTEEATQELANAFDVLDEALQSLDELMLALETNHEFFVGSYTHARKIVDIGSRKMDVRVSVTDAANHAELPDVELTLIPVATLHHPVKCTSGKTGKANFKSLFAGTYDMLAKIQGYADVFIQNIAVLNGKIADVAIEMQRL